MQSEPPSETRERLLQAAGEVFAEMGFRNATIRDICQRASANIAAVNYHFGDKEALYSDVLAYTAEEAFKKYPPGAGLAEAAPPEKKLEGFVSTYLDRLLDEGRPAWHGKLISREMVEPTGALDGLIEHFVRPQWSRLRAIMRDLLGPTADETLLRRCACSVLGQCLFYKHARPVLDKIAPEQGFDAASRAEMARHIVAFSLAGVAAMRKSSGGSA